MPIAVEAPERDRVALGYNLERGMVISVGNCTVQGTFTFGQLARVHFTVHLQKTCFVITSYLELSILTVVQLVNGLTALLAAHLRAVELHV